MDIIDKPPKNIPKGYAKFFGAWLSGALMTLALTAGLAVHDNREIKAQRVAIDQLKLELANQVEAPPDLVKIKLLRVAERVDDRAIWAWVSNPNTGEWSKRFWNLCQKGPQWDKDIKVGAMIVDFWFRDDLDLACTDISNGRFEGYSLVRYTSGERNGQPILETSWHPPIN